MRGHTPRFLRPQAQASRTRRLPLQADRYPIPTAFPWRHRVPSANIEFFFRNSTLNFHEPHTCVSGKYVGNF